MLIFSFSMVKVFDIICLIQRLKVNRLFLNYKYKWKNSIVKNNLKYHDKMYFS